METTPLGQHANKNNSGPTIAHRPWREHCVVLLRHCSKKTRRLPFILHLQHRWDTHAFWAALEPNTGIQWEPKSASKILRSGKAELHCCSCCCCRWSKGAPRKSSSKASVHQEIWLCRSLFVFPSIRKGGWMNRASKNGFDRVCHMLSIPFWCGTHSKLTWPILWKMTWSSKTLTSQLSLEA